MPDAPQLGHSRSVRAHIYAISLVFYERHSVSNAWTRMAPSSRRNQSSRAATALAGVPASTDRLSEG